MSTPTYQLKTKFPFGRSTVRIIEGDILAPVEKIEEAVLVSSDDNYLTMHGGLSRALREKLGDEYVREVQAKCPVKAGTVICTSLEELKARQEDDGLDLDPTIEYIFHAAVIDYDTADQEIEEVVGQATSKCLDRAEDLGLTSVLFPVMGAGSGGVEQMEKCARAMCSAIKAYLAQERPIKQMVIVLHKRADEESAPNAEREARRLAFKRAANLVLDTPYNPLEPGHQARDFYGRQDLLQRVKDVLLDQLPDKRHILVMGGPKSGKWSLLDRLYYETQEPGNPLVDGRFFVKVVFGRIYDNTSLSFVYRKLLNAMARYETDNQLRQEILEKYAKTEIGCGDFLAFLDEHKQRYREVVFLVDELPNLLELKTDEAPDRYDIRSFWGDLDNLEERVRFFFTIRNDSQHAELMERLNRFTESFKGRIEEIWVPCISEQERTAWVDELFHYHFQTEGNAPFQVHEFFLEEAGRHPYLISLASYALIERIKRERIYHSDRLFDLNNRVFLTGSINDARKAIEEPRRKFFVALMELGREEKVDLLNLAKATALEQESQSLVSSLTIGDPNAVGRIEQLQSEGNPRDNLHENIMERLEQRGYVVRAEDKKWQFMCRPFANFVLETLGGLSRLEDRPTDVVISLLSGDDQGIRTMFRGRGARIIVAEKPLPLDLRGEFLEGFNQFLSYRIGSKNEPAEELVFDSAEAIGNFILTQFTSVSIKRYLQDPPRGCTVLFLVDDSLKEIPWELMLEAAYAGEIPFRVGRSIVSRQQAQNVRPPVRGASQIKALLIGDPTGDLKDAESEIGALVEMFQRDERFDKPDALLGKKDCKRVRILSALSSGKYGLVHYSGHSVFRGTQSAWQVADGNLTTDMLTNAVQMAPPAMIFSSSCSSAAGGESQQAFFEDQTFDLPGAFLQAGVEAYFGTLWEVDAQEARLVVEKFYEEFREGSSNLGECLRRAKSSRKQAEERQAQTDWLAFLLYGDPHIFPHEIFPALGMKEAQRG